MEQIGQSTRWVEGEFVDSTADPNISVSVISEEVPSLTVAAIIGVTLVVLIAIAVVFLLGVFIDWRQQRMLEKKMGEVKRIKNQRRVAGHAEADEIGIADNMEESATSLPPAEALRNVP